MISLAVSLRQLSCSCLIYITTLICGIVCYFCCIGSLTREFSLAQFSLITKRNIMTCRSVRISIVHRPEVIGEYAALILFYLTQISSSLYSCSIVFYTFQDIRIPGTFEFQTIPLIVGQITKIICFSREYCSRRKNRRRIHIFRPDQRFIFFIHSLGQAKYSTLTIFGNDLIRTCGLFISPIIIFTSSCRKSIGKIKPVDV
ncbi:hypothetical protein, partial [Faecalibaculum rodentium]|uniref:hypothetical protein n=1 Tax=Faecalibaculum rodentium TaxID=1702221 RepID=UPI0023F08D44